MYTKKKHARKFNHPFFISMRIFSLELFLCCHEKDRKLMSLPSALTRQRRGTAKRWWSSWRRRTWARWGTYWCLSPRWVTRCCGTGSTTPHTLLYSFISRNIDCCTLNLVIRSKERHFIFFLLIVALKVKIQRERSQCFFLLIIAPIVSTDSTRRKQSQYVSLLIISLKVELQRGRGHCFAIDYCTQSWGIRRKKSLCFSLDYCTQSQGVKRKKALYVFFCWLFHSKSSYKEVITCFFYWFLHPKLSYKEEGGILFFLLTIALKVKIQGGRNQYMFFLSHLKSRCKEEEGRTCFSYWLLHSKSRYKEEKVSTCFFH